MFFRAKKIIQVMRANFLPYCIMYIVKCIHRYVLRMYVIHISLVSTCPFKLDQPIFAIFGFPNLDIFVRNNPYTAL